MERLFLFLCIGFFVCKIRKNAFINTNVCQKRIVELNKLRKEIKEFKAKEIEQKSTIEDLKKELKELQKRLDSSPFPHTLECVRR